MAFLPGEDGVRTTITLVGPDIGTWRQILSGLVDPNKWLNQQAGDQLTATLPQTY